ncbi:MAG: 50S ribosomal protein L34e [Candidatus Korarchaeota archaeon]|nr:50S ribosomal protein L34e [Thermoproteota archaeon]MCR8488456.1 50S ribosomal protein L34e [Thermoproteota archaeon]
MPAPRYRSRSLRRRNIRTPGGRLVVHYKKKIKGKAHCAICGKELSGVPREAKEHPKSSRRPERPYGGFLCSSCLQRYLTRATIEKFAPRIYST